MLRECGCRDPSCQLISCRPWLRLAGLLTAPVPLLMSPVSASAGALSVISIVVLGAVTIDDGWPATPMCLQLASSGAVVQIGVLSTMSLMP